MKLIKLNAIGSTNTYLKELAASVALEDELVVVAKEQDKGRGQLGAVWKSQVGKSLTCSLFKRINGLSVTDQAMLNFTVSLALIKVLRKFNIPEVTVKWPNDIMSRQQKLAGILIENQVKGSKIRSSIIGIGLNVNETRFHDLPNATSMRMASETTHDIDKVLKEVYRTIFTDLNEIKENTLADLQRKYDSELFRKDIISVFEVDGKHLNGRILGVTAEGQLHVEHDDGNAVYGLKEVRLLY